MGQIGGNVATVTILGTLLTLLGVAASRTSMPAVDGYVASYRVSPSTL